MKLSKIYSNNDKKFKPIVFNDGLSIIYAAVTRPKDSEKDSHNLGKTLLIKLIDFTLLCGFKAGHFLYDHKDIFQDFEFFLEIKLNAGGYVTIRRSVSQNTKISLKRHPEPNQDFSELADISWDISKAPIKKTKHTLNEIVGLTSISPWDYRKGVSYFLRTQADYLDVFQTSRFAVGKHKDWKPYLAAVLGFPFESVQAKYEKDEAIEAKEKFRAEYSRQVSVDSGEYDRIKGTIEIKRAEVDENRKRIDRFNFFEKDLSINAELVSEIESRVAYLNEQLYDIGLEVERIRASLAAKVNFDLKQVREIFEEARLYFPEELAKSYEELQEFNTKLSEERNKRLEQRLEKLIEKRAVHEEELEGLNRERESLLEVLQNKDTFNKFRLLQSEIIQQETRIAQLQAELSNLDAMARIDREILALKQERQRLVSIVEEAVNAGNSTYSSIRQKLNEIIHHVLGVPALLSTKVNAEGNLEFNAQLIRDEETRAVTSEGQGTSYKKMLCAAFDMAVLETYATGSFYRFVYHDGVLEGLDERKKTKLLEAVDRFCETYQLQYILTMIDADVPRDMNNKKISFPKGTIVRELHERGDSGRLFNMQKF